MPDPDLEAIDLAPVFMTTDVAKALAHYESLGFDVTAYGDEYGFAHWSGANIHVARVGDVDPLANDCACFLYVTDADALHSRWSGAGADGRFIEPVDTDYGMREGAHIDPDGNLIRYGSDLNR